MFSAPFARLCGDVVRRSDRAAARASGWRRRPSSWHSNGCGLSSAPPSWPPCFVGGSPSRARSAPSPPPAICERPAPPAVAARPRSPSATAGATSTRGRRGHRETRGDRSPDPCGGVLNGVCGADVRHPARAAARRLGPAGSVTGWSAHQPRRDQFEGSLRRCHQIQAHTSGRRWQARRRRAPPRGPPT